MRRAERGFGPRQFRGQNGGGGVGVALEWEYRYGIVLYATS